MITDRSRRQAARYIRAIFGLPPRPGQHISPAEREAAQRARAAADRKRIPADLLARVRMSIAEPSATVWCTSYNDRLGTRPVDAWRSDLHRRNVINLLDAMDDGVIM